MLPDPSRSVLLDHFPGVGIDPHIIWVSLVQHFEVVVFCDPTSGIVAVVRWLDPVMMNEFIGLVMASLHPN